MLEEFNIEKFILEVDNLISMGIEYPDAVCKWCEKNNIEIEVVASNIKKIPAIKAKIFESAKRLKMVKD